jgi:hypothetical protein
VSAFRVTTCTPSTINRAKSSASTPRHRTRPGNLHFRIAPPWANRCNNFTLHPNCSAAAAYRTIRGGGAFTVSPLAGTALPLIASSTRCRSASLHVGSVFKIDLTASRVVCNAIRTSSFHCSSVTVGGCRRPQPHPPFHAPTYTKPPRREFCFEMKPTKKAAFPKENGLFQNHVEAEH